MLKLFNQFALSQKYRSDIRESASLNEVFGLLVRERKYSVNDPYNELNPFAPGSLFSGQWRNGQLEETDAYDQIAYKGAINDVSYTWDANGRYVEIAARDTFGVLKDWAVEELLLKSDAFITQQYKNAVARDVQHAGEITLTASGSPQNIAVGDFVSFGENIAPRYRVTSVTAGSPTPGIVLDRALEAAVPANAVLRVASPTVKTAPRAIKDALLAAGIQNLGNSFDALDEEDAAASLFVRLFIRRENKVRLAEHILKLMDMTDTILTVNHFGQVEVIRGLQYDGSRIETELTSKEIMPPLKIGFDTSKLYYAYDTLFDANGTVQVASGTVSDDILSAYAARNRWQPVSAESDSPNDYQYLYANATAAQFFGKRRISYNGHPRPRLTCALKPALSGKPWETLKLYLGQRFLITIDFGLGASLYREPAAVVQYSYDRERQMYPQVVFELTNWRFPNLPVAMGLLDTGTKVYLADEEDNRLLQENRDYIEVE